MEDWSELFCPFILRIKLFVIKIDNLHFCIIKNFTPDEEFYDLKVTAIEVFSVAWQILCVDSVLQDLSFLQLNSWKWIPPVLSYLLCH